MSISTDHDGYPILAALVTHETEASDFTTTMRLYVCEVFTRECGSEGPVAYRVVLRAFWDGHKSKETDWLYSSWHAFEAWKMFARHECSMQPRQLEILAAEVAKEAA